MAGRGGNQQGIQVKSRGPAFQKKGGTVILNGQHEDLEDAVEELAKKRKWL